MSRRPYFFEIFTLANLALIVLLLWPVTRAPLATFGQSMFVVLPAFVVQTAIGVGIRAAWRRGEYLRAIRSTEWLTDTLRIIVFSALFVQTYGWIKLSVPLLHPHLADQALWDFDQALFFGHSPNVFFLDLFSRPAVLLRFFDWTYANVFVASINIASIIFLSAPGRRLRLGFMNSNTLMWIVGAWLYVAVPSLGPAYRFPQIWIPLSALLANTQQLQRILMTNYQHVLRHEQVNIFYGIAAFPSLHVGFEVLAYLWMRRVSRVAAAFFLAFIVIIFLGSVVTGWHYLIDSVAGAVLAIGCWTAVAIRKRAPAFPISCLN